MSINKQQLQGEIPKLTKSDNESNSTPKFELLLSNLAIFPSRLSKNEAKTTQATAFSHLNSIANFMAVIPSVKEKKSKNIWNQTS